MSQKTVKILTECIMCTILSIIMFVGASALYFKNQHNSKDPQEIQEKKHQ